MEPASACRVLHLLHSLVVGGKERVVLDLARTARAEGHDDRVLLFDADRVRPVIDLDPGDIPVDSLLRRRGFDWRYPSRLRSYLSSHPARILHAHNDSALVYAAHALRGRKRGRPRLMVTYHNLPSHASWGARVLARWAAKRADGVVTVSADLGRRLQAARWISEGEVVFNGVDTGRFGPRGGTEPLRSRLGLTRETLLVGSVARFSSAKRQIDLVEALRSARGQGHELALVLVGCGPELEAVRARAEGCERVFFLPRVPDVAAFLRSLDVFCLCSEHEGLPLSLLEAMATGLAVVTTAVGGIPELVGGARRPCCLLVEPRRPAELCEALIRLLSPDLRRKLGDEAQAHVRRSFPLELMASRYQDLYSRLMG